MEPRDKIEQVIIRQKERLNDQLHALYTLVSRYHALTGINPISGQKSISFGDIAEKEIHFITTTVRNPRVYPILAFEQRLLACLDPKKGTVESLDQAASLMRLLKETKALGDRFLLIEVLKSVRSPIVLEYGYANGLVDVLKAYLEENCDIITNYDYILSLLSLLSTIPLPTPRLSLASPVLTEYSRCGDPDIEDLAVSVEEHWK
ncbi:hypothetical protein WA577_007483, partial [Blastocystis sp. JDR]